MRYVPKQPPHGVQNPGRWWGSPVSPTHPLRQAYNQMFYGATMPLWLASANRRVRNGRGMLFHATGFYTQEAPVTITHALGRRPQAIFTFASGAVQQYPARVRFAPGPINSQQCTIAFDQNVSDQWLWIV